MNYYDRQTIIVPANDRYMVLNSSEYDHFMLRSNSDSVNLVQVGFNGGKPSRFSVGDKYKAPKSLFVDDVVFQNPTGTAMEIDYVLTLGDFDVSAIVQSEAVIVQNTCNSMLSEYMDLTVLDSTHSFVTAQDKGKQSQLFIYNHGPSDVRFGDVWINGGVTGQGGYLPVGCSMFLDIDSALYLRAESGTCKVSYLRFGKDLI